MVETQLVLEKRVIGALRSEFPEVLNHRLAIRKYLLDNHIEIFLKKRSQNQARREFVDRVQKKFRKLHLTPKEKTTELNLLKALKHAHSLLSQDMKRWQLGPYDSDEL